jgi:hypothetical protein
MALPKYASVNPAMPRVSVWTPGCRPRVCIFIGIFYVKSPCNFAGVSFQRTLNTIHVRASRDFVSVCYLGYACIDSRGRYTPQISSPYNSPNYMHIYVKLLHCWLYSCLWPLSWLAWIRSENVTYITHGNLERMVILRFSVIYSSVSQSFCYRKPLTQSH